MSTDPQKVALLLLANRDTDSSFWQWVEPGKPLSRKDANKFLLGCILDYQMLATRAWENARRLAEDILQDPDDLWSAVTARSLADWMAMREEYALHRFPKGHERVYTIAKRMVDRYAGDARNLWRDESIDGTLHRLNELGLGEQLSRMAVGALIDTGHLRGKGDVKVDIHVRRVLGRIVRGKEFATEEAHDVLELTRSMHPENPWLLDRPLYRLGQSACLAGTPKCSSCFVRPACTYATGHA